MDNKGGLNGQMSTGRGVWRLTPSFATVVCEQDTQERQYVGKSIPHGTTTLNPPLNYNIKAKRRILRPKLNF